MSTKCVFYSSDFSSGFGSVCRWWGFYQVLNGGEGVPEMCDVDHLSFRKTFREVKLVEGVFVGGQLLWPGSRKVYHNLSAPAIPLRPTFHFVIGNATESSEHPRRGQGTPLHFPIGSPTVNVLPYLPSFSLPLCVFYTLLFC